MNITKINTRLAPRTIKFIILFAAFAAGLVFPSTLSAATYTVTNTSDNGAGSLRGAIATANGTTADDMINFAIPSTDANCTASGVCTITLTSGELLIDITPTGGSLTITNSTGAANLIISGNNQSRIFFVFTNFVSSISNFILNGVTVTKGNGTGNNFPTLNGRGTGILNEGGGVVTITNCIISGNIGNSSSIGGGIFTGGNGARSTLTMTNSTVSGNTSRIDGGVSSWNGTLTITNSTISGNVGTFNDGGGIGIHGGTTTIMNSTITGNSTPTSYGGGIHHSEGFVKIINSTVSRNSAFAGGGIYSDGTSNSTISIRNTIVVANTANAAGGYPDIWYRPAGGTSTTGTFQSSGNNLIGNATDTNLPISWQSSDILNQSARLAPLGNYGGTTQTMSLLATSPAINAGNNCVLTVGGCGTNDPLTALTTDQRGFARNGQVDIGAVERQTTETFKTPFDFDGDGKTDIGIFRPAPGEWWYSRSSNNQVAALQFGAASDKIVSADFTGDGKADIAFWRPSTGFWFVLRSEDSSFFSFPFGTNGDIPAPADYDGDGKVDAAVFRPSSSTWFIRRSSDGGTTITNFGISQDKPVVADYDGDGKADIAIFRPSVGEWWYQRSSNGTVAALQFGTSTDKPVPADYTGDGKADIAFFRPSTGFWFILRSEDASFFSFPFGTSGDIPVVGDYDGDGKTDTAVFRPSSSTWYVNRTTAGVLITTFGISGDQPVPSAFVP